MIQPRVLQGMMVVAALGSVENDFILLWFHFIFSLDFTFTCFYFKMKNENNSNKKENLITSKNQNQAK